MEDGYGVAAPREGIAIAVLFENVKVAAAAETVVNNKRVSVCLSFKRVPIRLRGAWQQATNRTDWFGKGKQDAFLRRVQPPQ